MKILLFSSSLPRLSWRRDGLTILEMLVSTAMLSFIVVGLTAVFIQTQKAFKSGIKQNTITDSGRSIMEMIIGDLRQMSDAQNTNWPVLAGAAPANTFVNPNYNFYWDLPNNPAPVTNYLVTFINKTPNLLPIRTNQLDEVFILEHTNTVWVGTGYAVSNYPGVAFGALYRYETNWTSLAPTFTNDLFSAFYTNISSANFNTNFWHKVADGVVDLKITAFDQYGNTNYPSFLQDGYVGYPIGGPPVSQIYYMSNTLPYSVELEFAILEPDALTRARSLALPGNSAALNNFLSTNAATQMEVFRQRINIPAAAR